MNKAIDIYSLYRKHCPLLESQVMQCFIDRTIRTTSESPTSFQLSAVQWSLVLIGFGLSGGVLALSLWPDLSKKSAKFGTILVVVVVGLHLLLACSFMLAFFHAPAAAPVQVVDPVLPIKFFISSITLCDG